MADTPARGLTTDARRQSADATVSIGIAWILACAPLVLWSAYRLYRWSRSVGRFSGPRDVTLIFVAFALFGLVGGVFAIRRKAAGRILLVVMSWLALAYAVAFVLMHGVEDTSLGYGVAVLALATLAVATLAVRKRLGV